MISLDIYNILLGCSNKKTHPINRSFFLIRFRKSDRRPIVLPEKDFWHWHWHPSQFPDGISHKSICTCIFKMVPKFCLCSKNRFSERTTFSFAELFFLRFQKKSEFGKNDIARRNGDMTRPPTKISAFWSNGGKPGYNEIRRMLGFPAHPGHGPRQPRCWDRSYTSAWVNTTSSWISFRRSKKRCRRWMDSMRFRWFRWGFYHIFYGFNRIYRIKFMKFYSGMMWFYGNLREFHGISMDFMLIRKNWSNKHEDDGIPGGGVVFFCQITR